jgi:hypothetical protein
MSVAAGGARAVELDRIAELTDAPRLTALLGPIAGIAIEPVVGKASYSSSQLQRVRVHRAGAGETALVLKRTDAGADWINRRSGARRSREIDLLRADELTGVWSVFANPYLAFAEEGTEAGLLLHDLSAYVFPDERAPIAREHEDLLLHALARLHAQFWARTLSATDWMASLDVYAELMGPHLPGHADEALIPGELRSAIVAGWAEAFRRLPPRVVEHLRSPAPEVVRPWAELPRTVVHGDAKVANFTILPDRRVAAFDWALVGWAPASVDLGWYLAVNASRLSRSKEELVVAYRRLLELQLGLPFAPAEWRLFEDAAIDVGARMLLWSKANAAASGRAAAQAEWEWWAERLARLV